MACDRHVHHLHAEGRRLHAEGRHDDAPNGRAPFPLPGTQRRFTRDRSVDLRHVVLEIDVDFEARSIAGRVTHRLRALRPGVREIALDAVALEIGRVTLGGREAPFRHDGARLVVVSPRDLPEGRDSELTVAYRCRPRRGFYFVGPDAASPERPLHAWSQGEDEDSRRWWPVHDHPNERATTEMVATVPADHVAISNGRLVSSRRKGSRRTWHWKQEEPHVPYLVTLAVGPFESVEQEGPVLPGRRGRLPMRTWFLPGRREDARRCVKDTPRMVELFSTLTGEPYPFAKYDQVFVGAFIFGGMENTSATTLTDLVLHDERAAIDFSCEDLVSHELAHQWFGNLITCRDWSQAWLNEGFATWAEVAWKRAAHGEDEAWVLRRDLRDEYFDEDRESYRRPVACRTYADPIELFDAHLYQKGAWVVEMLRHELGDLLFRRALADYVRSHRGTSVETADLRRAVERACGRSFERFFDQWIESAGYPELEVTAEWEGERGDLVVHVRQLQAGEGTPEAFEATLDVALLVAGEWRRATARLTRREQTLVFPLPEEPRAVALDPEDRLLATVKWDRPVLALVALLDGAPWAPARAHAAAALGRDGSDPAVRALGRALSREGEFWGVKAAAASALAEARTDEALKLLVRAVTAAHPKARRAVAQALGAFRRPEAAKALTRWLAKGDESALVEAEVATSLGRTQQPGALATLERVLARKDAGWNEVIRCGALDGLGHLAFDERAAAIGAALPWARADRFVRCQQAAVRALSRLGTGHDGARERLERLAEDGEYRVAVVATKGLGTLAHRSSQAALARIADTTLDGRLRRSARESLRKLGDGGPAAAAKVRSDLEALQVDVKGLRQRLEKAEQRLQPAVAEQGERGQGSARGAGSKIPGTRRRRRS